MKCEYCEKETKDLKFCKSLLKAWNEFQVWFHCEKLMTSRNPVTCSKKLVGIRLKQSFITIRFHFRIIATKNLCRRSWRRISCQAWNTSKRSAELISNQFYSFDIARWKKNFLEKRALNLKINSTFHIPGACWCRGHKIFTIINLISAMRFPGKDSDFNNSLRAEEHPWNC